MCGPAGTPPHLGHSFCLDFGTPPSTLTPDVVNPIQGFDQAVCYATNDDGLVFPLPYCSCVFHFYPPCTSIASSREQLQSPLLPEPTCVSSHPRPPLPRAGLRWAHVSSMARISIR
ncbi:hypothetical protein Pmani_039204 [Petrolisthes manimaculis]|uniref:Uncharacterized protein n=1 Tax=Petrolisthes manimaculis TaxID=1843537 RepID=A0AAE1NFG5_9EUCA|nr:hypothetical protein Pmani_039204 [Petrolisthes manimaculis]